jgi:hypothetical protein
LVRFRDTGGTVLEPTRIGFSTTDALLSRLIRRLTRSTVSHAFLVYRDVDFEREMVMEAVGAGFRIVPLDKFAKHNRIVAIVKPRHPIDEGLKAAVDWLGEGYDAPGLVGMAVLLVLRALRRRKLRVRNLLARRSALFCSEAVARACRASRYPGFDRDPETTTPQDLFAFFEAETGVPAARAATA